MLATIISTSGSTPASAFSKMVIRNRGKEWVGTVGGGCMEGDVLAAAKELYDQQKARILTFHLNEDDMVQGLICGGTLDVLIEPVLLEHAPLIQEMRSLRDQGEDCVIATLLYGDTLVWKRLLRHPEAMDGLMDQWRGTIHQLTTSSIQYSATELAEESRKSHHRNETRRVRLPDGELLLEPITGRPNLIVFGGGHVSKSISTMAAMAGFLVTIVDDRKEYANPDRFPEADCTLAVEFYEAFNHLTIKPSSYIVIVTRGHRSDEVVLEQALKTPAKYIGMIGSRRKVLTTYEHLVERGVTVEELRRVHAPMGLDIGAVTAEEIGISVVAQMINIRRGGQDSLRDKSDAMRDLIGRLGRGR